MPLIQQVIERGFCTGCGGCVCICPHGGVIVSEAPDVDPDLLAPYNILPEYKLQARLNRECLDCYACQKVCPKLDIPPKDPLGNYLRILSARSQIQGQDGGVVSWILRRLLEQDMIDCAICVARDSSWRSFPILIDDPGKIPLAAGSKYAATSVLQFLKQVLDRYSRIALVGTGCQAHAGNLIRYHVSDHLKLIIGLFCSESFSYHALSRFLSQAKLDPTKITKMDFKHGRFWIYLGDGSQPKSFRISEIAKHARSCCHYCLDITARFADISVGSVGSPDGWNTLIIRNQFGLKAFESTMDGLQIQDANLDQIRRFCELVSKRKHEIDPYWFQVRE